MNVYLASSSSPRSSIIETHSAIGPSDRTYEEEARGNNLFDGGVGAPSKLFCCKTEFSHEFAKQKRAIQDAAQALSLALDKHDDVGLNQLAIDVLLFFAQIIINSKQIKELTASRVNAHDHVSTALTSVATIVRLMNPLGVAASDEQRTQLIARRTNFIFYLFIYLSIFFLVSLGFSERSPGLHRRGLRRSSHQHPRLCHDPSPRRCSSKHRLFSSLAYHQCAYLSASDLASMTKLFWGLKRFNGSAVSFSSSSPLSTLPSPPAAAQPGPLGLIEPSLHPSPGPSRQSLPAN